MVKWKSLSHGAHEQSGPKKKNQFVESIPAQLQFSSNSSYLSQPFPKCRIFQKSEPFYVFLCFSYQILGWFFATSLLFGALFNGASRPPWSTTGPLGSKGGWRAPSLAFPRPKDEKEMFFRALWRTQLSRWSYIINYYVSIAKKKREHLPKNGGFGWYWIC